VRVWYLHSSARRVIDPSRRVCHSLLALIESPKRYQGLHNITQTQQEPTTNNLETTVCINYFFCTIGRPHTATAIRHSQGIHFRLMCQEYLHHEVSRIDTKINHMKREQLILVCNIRTRSDTHPQKAWNGRLT
jgi:hypothetical protein